MKPRFFGLFYNNPLALTKIRYFSRGSNRFLQNHKNNDKTIICPDGRCRICWYVVITKSNKNIRVFLSSKYQRIIAIYFLSQI